MLLRLDERPSPAEEAHLRDRCALLRLDGMWPTSPALIANKAHSRFRAGQAVRLLASEVAVRARAPRRAVRLPPDQPLWYSAYRPNIRFPSSLDSSVRAQHNHRNINNAARRKESAGHRLTTRHRAWHRRPPREGRADVGINDVEHDRAAEDTLELVRREERSASWHLADISKSTDVNSMVDDFVRQHGRIDILVNNAVASIKKPFLEIAEQDWDFEVGNALKGYFLCSQRAAREMVKQGDGGSVVSVSSVHAFRAWPNDLVYGTCKAGLVRMTMSMALDLAGQDINCNCVAPGYIDSRVLSHDQEHLRGGATYPSISARGAIPGRRIGTPDDIARAVLFLCSPLGDYVNGQCITVDGGLLTSGVPED